MKTIFSFSGGIVVLICLCLLIPAVGAQESNKVEVVAAAICKDVVAREAVDVANSFFEFGLQAVLLYKNCGRRSADRGCACLELR